MSSSTSLQTWQLVPSPTNHLCHELLPYFLVSRSTRRRRGLRGCFRANAANNTTKIRKIESCWVPANDQDDGLGGWLVPATQLETPPNGLKKKSSLVVWLAASVAIVLVAGLSWQASTKKGLKDDLVATFHFILEKMPIFGSKKVAHKDNTSRGPEATQVPRRDLDEKADVAIDHSKENNVKGGVSHVSVKVHVDSTQQEALSVLKKLEIIENDAGSGEFCTRRDFARWLVKVSSKLERKRKHMIVPDVTDGSVGKAFDDVDVNDPDFWTIQSLGESGIVPSKLSSSSSESLVGSPSNGQRNYNFFPESYLSRFDLVNWKTLLEYPFACRMDEKMLNKRVGLLDLSACPVLSASLIVDLMAGEDSIFRGVFGNTRRLQPHRPVTKAQAAVALTSGRMKEAIRDELNRLEAENLTRFAEMAEVREEFIQRGEIQKFWLDKVKKEQDREVEVGEDLQYALLELAKETKARKEKLEDYLKEKGALDCQQQLLQSLRSEVDGMYDRLATERAEIMASRQSLEKLSSDMQKKHGGITEAKSFLEAEKKALNILRSWIEDEAICVHARTEVLEQAVRRWRRPSGDRHS